MSRKTSNKTRKTNKSSNTGVTTTSDASNQIDDSHLPDVKNDITTTGAAADSADADEPFARLPRLLRYAALVTDNADHIEQRLHAEIRQLCPDDPLNLIWGRDFNAEIGITLAADLDLRAAADDRSELRSLADCVRLVCLPVPRDGANATDHRRVAKALLMAFRKSAHDVEERLRSRLEAFVFGWAALPVETENVPRRSTATVIAIMLGKESATHRIDAAKRAIWRQVKQEKEDAKAAAERVHVEVRDVAPQEAVPAHHLVVARLSDEQMKNPKLREILGPLKSVINVALPLVLVPPLHQVRQTLLFEFPYAQEVIDFALADLVGRTSVKISNLVLVGPPGGGKSRFARRFGETLGLSVWREDASRADGATFGGTDRRWYSAEPCHPFLAIAQGKIANPMVQLEELEKAATRNDYGRLFDCLLGFLEPESAMRYPDPALQVSIDVSQVSYIATCNSLDPLPGPLRDRLRAIEFPKPTAAHLDALLPAVMADLTQERGLDIRWVHPLDDIEHTAIRQAWHGGSVRRLRRIVEAVLRNRERHATRN